MSHGEPATWPRLADLLGYCRPEQAVAIAEAVVTTQRDFGDRTDRKHARLKYTIADRGLDWFRAEVERRAGIRLEPPRPYIFTTRGDRYGWERDDAGLWHLALFVESGRLRADEPADRLGGLREIAARVDCELRITANQNLIIARVADEDRVQVDEIARRHGLIGDASATRRAALACVGLPTCGLAMAESERYLPELLARFESLLARHGLAEEAVSLRITGCPNGCARPYIAEIGLVGKGPGRYNLYLGGDALGQRLNRLYLENVDEAAIFAALDPLLAAWAAERATGEDFGDYLVRAGHVAVVAQPADIHEIRRGAA
jgi:sulfite reductase (NADPH) hemoprotein beta-component